MVLLRKGVDAGLHALEAHHTSSMLDIAALFLLAYLAQRRQIKLADVVGITGIADGAGARKRESNVGAFRAGLPARTEDVLHRGLEAAAGQAV